METKTNDKDAMGNECEEQQTLPRRSLFGKDAREKERMRNSPQSAPFEKKMEFVVKVVEGVQNRRVSIENRASFLIAANAIFLNALVQPGLNVISNTPLFRLKIVLTVITLVTVLLSIVICVRFVLSPRTVKNPPDAPNLIAFQRIAEFNKLEYFQSLNAITEQEILWQHISQVHNQALLLGKRYQYLKYANLCFMIGIVSFAILVFTAIST